MRKLLLALPLLALAASCQNFTWKGQAHGLTQAEDERGLQDITELTREYESMRFWSQVRARRDGRVNAWAEGFAKFQDTIDRHVFNYSTTDPYLNRPTELTVPEVMGRFTVGMLAR